MGGFVNALVIAGIVGIVIGLVLRGVLAAVSQRMRGFTDRWEP